MVEVRDGTSLVIANARIHDQPHLGRLDQQSVNTHSEMTLWSCEIGDQPGDVDDGVWPGSREARLVAAVRTCPSCLHHPCNREIADTPGQVRHAVPSSQVGAALKSHLV